MLKSDTQSQSLVYMNIPLYFDCLTVLIALGYLNAWHPSIIINGLEENVQCLSSWRTMSVPGSS